LIKDVDFILIFGSTRSDHSPESSVKISRQQKANRIVHLVLHLFGDVVVYSSDLFRKEGVGMPVSQDLAINICQNQFILFLLCVINPLTLGNGFGLVEASHDTNAIDQNNKCC